MRTACLSVAMLLLLVAPLSIGRAGLGAGAAIPVSTTADDLLANRNCTLREAIVAANTDGAVDACPADAGPDVILLPAGAYLLTIPGRAEEAAVSGDLDLAGDLTLLGAGAGQTLVDAGSLDRAFEILPGANVKLSGLSLQNGDPGPAQDGGGIVVAATARLSLVDVEIRGNRVAGDRWGGGIRNNGITTLDLARVAGNTAGYAGGIANGGVLTATHSTVSDNAATNFAGGVYSASRVSISDSAVNGNASAASGGGLYLPGGVTALTNVTVSGNRANNGYPGGGFWIYYMAGVTLTNCTIANNKAAAGSGIYYMEPPGGVGESVKVLAVNDEVKLQNSLLGGNLGTNCARNALAPPLISLGHNLDSDGSCEFSQPGDLNHVDAKLGALRSNGGPTWTHALLPGSPAIDAGDNTACPVTDQRGIHRPLDGNNDGLADCDIGAYESDGAGQKSGMYLPLIVSH